MHPRITCLSFPLSRPRAAPVTANFPTHVKLLSALHAASCSLALPGCTRIAAATRPIAPAALALICPSGEAERFARAPTAASAAPSSAPVEAHTQESGACELEHLTTSQSSGQEHSCFVTCSDDGSSAHQTCVGHRQPQ